MAEKKWKPAKAKSWRSKLEQPAEPQIKPAPEVWINRYGGDKMLIPTPQLVEAKLRQIPEGRLMTVAALRGELADDVGADFTCPMTTGIFARIVAEATEEDRAAARPDLTPYWRLIKDDGTLQPKFTEQAALLEKEGFILEKKGKNALQVKDFESFLF